MPFHATTTLNAAPGPSPGTPWDIGTNGVVSAKPTGTLGVDATDRYIAGLDIAALARAGVDYRHPRYGLEGLPPLAELDHVHDYRFERLTEITAKLRGVDRRRVLAHIFAVVTAGAANDTDRCLRTIWFVHMNMFPNIVQVMRPDGRTVYDPLILLEASEYRCGHAARLVLDLLEAGAGWPGRLVLMHCHVAAEVFFEGGWRLVEPTYYPPGVYPVKSDGTIPAVSELEAMPELLDRLPLTVDPGMDLIVRDDGRRELLYQNPRRSSLAYPSRFYCAKEAFATMPLQHLVKTAPSGPPLDEDYGWWHYVIEPAPRQPQRLGQDKWMPSAPMLTDLVMERLPENRCRVRLIWSPAVDGNDDVVDYRVMVGSHSRRWNYLTYDGPPHLKTLVSQPHPDPIIAYMAQSAPPPHDIFDATTPEGRFEFTATGGRTIYLSLYARDAYGLSIGKTFFYPGHEMELRLP